MIEIVPYCPIWPEEFAGLARAIRNQLGDLALRIDHIGSTSVAGLAAKDVIDIQVTVRELEAAVEEGMLALGYSRHAFHTDHIPPGAPPAPEDWVKWLFIPGPHMRRAHVHVRMAGKPNQRFALLFRDYLRAHANAAEAYLRVKQALARLHPDDMGAYSHVKDPVVDIILEAADAWATATQWTPGPPDA